MIETLDGKDMLPGKTLSRLGPVELGELEQHFKIVHLSEAVSAAKTTEAAQVLVANAIQNNVDGKWRSGTLGFAYATSTPSNLPKMLYLALRRCHPEITEPEAALFITPANAERLQCGVMALCGLSFKRPPK